MSSVQPRETLLVAAADLGPYLHQDHVHISTLPLCSQENKMILGHVSTPCPFLEIPFSRFYFSVFGGLGFFFID